MFEMFTGALPYEANTPASMMYAHLNAPPHKPSELVPDIPPQLEKIILKGLEKEPEQRYQDVDSLLEALQPFIKTTRRDANDISWSKRGDLSASGRHFEVSPFATPAQTPAAPITPSPEKASPASKAPVTAPPPAPVSLVTEISSDLQAPPPAVKSGSMPTMLLRDAPSLSDRPAVEQLEEKRESEPSHPLIAQQHLDQPMPASVQSKRLPVGVIAGGSAVLVLIILGIWFASHRSETPTQPSQTAASVNEKSVPTSTPQKQNPAPAVAPSVGSVLKNVKIDTAPSAASIMVDGKDTGLKTPASISVDPHQMHEVQLQLAGYEPLKHSVDQNPPANLLLQMKPLPGQLQYKGKIPVSIYSDKKLLFNATDGATFSLPAGTYTLTMITTNKAYIKDVQTIEVKPQEVSTIAPPETGSLSITANPSNCKIFINGVFIDSPPIFDLPLQAGNHQIRVAWEKQGKDKTIDITVAAGQSKTLRATMDNETTDVVEQSSN
jgi:PEGA domain